MDQLAQLITQTIRVAGVVIVFIDALTDPPGISPETWAGALVMMAGAQGIDAARDAIGGRKK